MFSIDERLRGLPAVKEQVVQLYQSLNAPHLAVPGRRAGPATAFVLGLRGPSGFAVFVYLYLSESGECAVYAPSNGTVPADKYQSEESEALGFTESMGFIMDNLNFRGRPADEQDSMIRSFPLFQREPPPPTDLTAPAGASGKPGTGRKAGVVVLGKLFSAFCLALLVGSACVHVPSELEKKQAQIHYDLAVQMVVSTPQAAMKEIDEALALDPTMADGWHLKGLILQHGFARLEEAQTCYLKAMELKQPFSEARTSMGTVYMDQKRYDDAIAQYEQALSDVMYASPFIAQANMGWAYFRKGDTRNAIEHLKAATNINPKFCLAYLQLGQVYESTGDTAESCKYFGRYREHCPDRADAHQREGVCLANAGQGEAAKKAFEQCVERAVSDDQRDLCKQLRDQHK